MYVLVYSTKPLACSENPAHLMKEAKRLLRDEYWKKLESLDAIKMDKDWTTKDGSFFHTTFHVKGHTTDGHEIDDDGEEQHLRICEVNTI